MKSWFRIVNKAEDADIYIYDEIGGWGVTAKNFIKEVKEIKGNITLHINSPGGDVFDGIAIHNTIKNLPGSVTVKIEGLAASIASVVAMAGDSVEMAENSMMMIHNPWNIIGGEAKDFEKMAEVLTKVKSLLISTYQSKTLMDEDEISRLMDDETWLSASEAKDLGFIDKITASVKISNNYNNNKFNNIKAYQEWEKIIATSPKDEPGSSPSENIETNRGEDMDKLFNILNVKTEEEVIARINTFKTANEELKAEIKILKEDALKNVVAVAIAEGKISEDQKEYAEKLIVTDKELYDGFVAQVAKVKDSVPPVAPKPVNIKTKVNPDGVTWEDLSRDPIALAELKNSNPAEYQRVFDKYMEGLR